MSLSRFFSFLNWIWTFSCSDGCGMFGHDDWLIFAVTFCVILLDKYLNEQEVVDNFKLLADIFGRWPSFHMRTWWS